MKRVIVDASVMIASLMRDGRARAILLNATNVAFYAPAFLFLEVEAHMDEIVRRAKVPRSTLEAVVRAAEARITIIPESVTSQTFDEACRLARKARADGDEEYIALALAFDAPIWSYDHDFDRVPGIKRISTTEVLSEGP